MDQDCNYICVDKCDACGRRAVGVMLHHLGTPVLFLCGTRLCGGDLAFEAAACRDIDRWLAEPRQDDLRRNEAIDREIECLMVEMGLTGLEAA